MKIPNLLFLVGTDRFQLRLYIEELRTKIFPNGSGGLNDDSFNAKEHSLVDVLDLANTLPMMSDRRFILYRNAENPKEADQARWLTYLENPSPQTTLVVTAKKMDGRSKLAKALAKAKVVVSMEEPKARDLSMWVDRIAQRNGMTLEGGARRSLIEAIGPDLSRMDQEIAKLALYIYPDKKIPEKAVKELVLQLAGESVFAWTDQVVEGRTAEAYGTLDHLYGTGTPALVLLSMLARHVRILLKARSHLARRAGRTELPRLIGVPPFTVDRYVTQAKGFSAKGLNRTMSELALLDQELKSTGHPPKLLLEKAMRAISHHRAA